MARQVIRAQSTRREYRKFLGVIAFIALASLLMSTLVSVSLFGWARWFVGSSLLVFGGFKLIAYENFLEVFPRYDLVAQRYRWYAAVYPFLQVILGFCFILNLFPSFRYVVTFLVMGVGLYGIFKSLQVRGPTGDYTWLGNFLKLPLSTAILFEDAIITLLSLFLVVGSVFFGVN